MTTNSMRAADANLPKEVSLTDPQAAWVARKNTDPFFAYDANYLIDNKAGIIVDAEGTRASRIAEIAITKDHAGPGREALRPSTTTARRRHCLWCSQAAQVAGRSQDNPAHPGVGQVDAF